MKFASVKLLIELECALISYCSVFDWNKNILCLCQALWSGFVYVCSFVAVALVY